MINVVKIGGNIVDNPEALLTFLKDFSDMPGLKILVHGGGKEATRLSERLEIPAVMIDGRRVTDRATLDIVTMVYAGLINKRVVSLLQSLGCNAMGLTGTDGNVIPAIRRSPIPIDYGYVGDIDPASINSGFISTLIEEGIVPVFCAICHDGQGSLLNCNADSVAAAVAQAVSGFTSVKLVYCFEKPGVLVDPDDNSTVIHHITPQLFEKLKEEGIVTKGMIPKLQNALQCISKGVNEVRICGASDLNNDRGTIITDN